MESHDAQPAMRKRGQVVAEDSPGGGAGPTAEGPEAVAERKQKEHRKDAGCCMRLLRSHAFKVLTFALVATPPVFGLFVTLPVLLEKHKCTDWLCQTRHYCIGLFLAVQFMYNFAMTQWTDPGSCKKIKPTYEALGQFELTLSTEPSSGEKKRLLGNDEGKPEPSESPSGEGSELSVLYAPNFCELCQHWKPPRSHHCTYLKRCVLRMDHYCPFTGNCIGASNHGHFLLMYFFASVGLIYVLSLCVWVIIENHKGAFAGIWQKNGFFAPGSMPARLPKSMADVHKGVVLGVVPNLSRIAPVLLSHGHEVLIATGTAVAAQTVVSAIALIAVLSFGIPAFWLASQGATIIETNFPMKEYVQIKPQVYCPLGPGFYRQSWKENIGQLLGPRWYLRLLLPMRGAIDPSLGVSPRPSADGVRALRERIDQVAKEGAKREVRSCRDLGINPGPPSTESGAVV